MRITVLFALSIFFFSFSPIPKTKHLVGKWEIYKIQKKDKNPKELRDKFLHFNIDGSIKAGTIGQDPNKLGTWFLDKNTKVLSLKTNMGNKDDGDYLIIKLTKKEMTLRKDTYDVFLEKVGK
jgi:hypothetical protein